MTSSDIKPELLPFDEIVRRVLKSVPPDGSPVFSLLPEIWAAPQALAPEKSDSLVPYLRPIRILPSVGKFILSASERFISVSDGALNLLWCASYAAWFIYQAYVDAQKNDLQSVQLGKDPEAVTALDLYEWAIQCVRTEKHDPWPTDAPRPSRTPPFTLPVQVANEVFLVAVGWMLLHELGHIAHRHPFMETSRAKLEENEADRFATLHMLEGVSDPSVLLKRSIGIAVANVLLVLLDILPETASSNAYPPAEERLSRNLRENQLLQSHPVHAFTTALLQVHLQRFGVPHDLNEKDTFASFVDDFCLVLRRRRMR
jgi:Peptidase U49